MFLLTGGILNRNPSENSLSQQKEEADPLLVDALLLAERPTIVETFYS